MGYDVFVSYASKDKLVADAVCARLESAGIRCWIAPRDIVAGRSYGEAIIEAIHVAKVMVLVFSSNANFSAHIPKEVERAVSNGVAILPFRIEDVAPGKSLDYFIGSVHWLDALTPPMEKHLDDLAATVHKLLPANEGGEGASVKGAWQQSAPPATTVRPPSRVEPVRASPSKLIWIGAAAVALLAVIAGGVMLSRTGRNSPNTANVSPATNLPTTTNDPNKPPPATGAQPIAEAARPIPKRQVKDTSDPLVGCYQWFNNAPVVVHANGTVIGGPFTGHWKMVNAARREYALTWPEAMDTITISPDQHSLSGANQYGYPVSGTRLTGTSGLVGIWRWPNGVPVTVDANGEFSVGPFRGRWKTIDASGGIYTLTWPNPVDSIALTADGSRVSGSNQFGVAISGVRTQPCAEN